MNLPGSIELVKDSSRVSLDPLSEKTPTAERAGTLLAVDSADGKRLIIYIAEYSSSGLSSSLLIKSGG